VNAYIDSSALLRVVLNERDALEAWRQITNPVSSTLIQVECLRTVDRARLMLSLEDTEVARLREDLIEVIERFTLVELDAAVLGRASEPFPTLLGTLDSIHLASAILVRDSIPDLRFATHDQELALAARSIGFELVS
jgi:predicted nucleic acid-binding protein